MTNVSALSILQSAQLLRGLSLPWKFLSDAGSRVARYLVEVAPSAPGHAFPLPVLKKDVALHLNLTQETLSRTLRKLSESELIESLADGSVRILDQTEMQKIALVGFPS